MKSPSIWNQGKAATFDIQWMRCANQKCGETIIQITKQRLKLETFDPTGASPIEQDVITWTAYPRHATRLIDPLVPERFRRDYLEAAAILDASPRMSSVLSRRILADLLEDFAKCAAYTIAGQIDKFMDDPSRPTNIKEDLHYLREIADFSAHTKKDRDTGEIIEVSPEEAEWTLHIVDRLFDYFIVGPERSATLRAAIDGKLSQAGRKPIRKLPEDGDDKIEPA